MAADPFATVDDYAGKYELDDVPARVESDLIEATEIIRRYCGWHIAPAITETRVIDGPGTSLLMLPTLRLTAVTALTEQQRGRGAAVRTLVPADDLEWSEAGIVRKHGGGYWTARMRGISITYTHGYAEVPPELAAIVLKWAQRFASNPSGLQLTQEAYTVGSRTESRSYSGSSATGSAAVVPDEKLVLDRYARVL
jgi:hypothetical protein